MNTRINELGIREENGLFYVYNPDFKTDPNFSLHTTVTGGSGVIRGPFENREDAQKEIEKLILNSKH